MGETHSTISNAHLKDIYDRLKSMEKILEGADLQSLPIRFKDEISLLKELDVKQKEIGQLREEVTYLKKQYIHLQDLLKASLNNI